VSYLRAVVLEGNYFPDEERLITRESVIDSIPSIEAPLMLGTNCTCDFLSLTLEIKNLDGGGRGIRTPGTLSSSTVFKTAGFNHSPIPPILSYLIPSIYSHCRGDR
jgi:hypothetical protein